MYDDKCLPQLIIPENVKQEIEYLNSKNKNREWSGIIFYVIKEGNVTNIKDLVLEAKGIFLKDIGTSGSTSYEFSSDVVEYMDMKAEELGIEPAEIYTTWKIGHHHSHHNMTTSPSVTDNEEVEDNIKNHVMYLTTISNNSLDISVHVSIHAKIATENCYTIRDHENAEHVVCNKGEFDGILKYKGEVKWESNASVTSSFIKRYEELEAKMTKTKTYSPFNDWKGGEGYDRYYGSQLSIFDEKEKNFKKLKEQLIDDPIEEILDLDSLMLLDLILYKDEAENLIEIDSIRQALYIVDRQLTTPHARLTYLNGLEDYVDKCIVRYNMESVSAEEHDTQIKDMMDLLEDESHELAKSIKERLRRKLFIKSNTL